MKFKRQIMLVAATTILLWMRPPPAIVFHSVKLCLCVLMSQLSIGVEESVPCMRNSDSATPGCYLYKLSLRQMHHTHTDRDYFLQISSQGTPGTPFCVYWIRLIHMDASTASMELHDEDPVNPETWEWLEQGKDGKPMRHLDVVHPIPQISADGMIWSMPCF